MLGKEGPGSDGIWAVIVNGVPGYQSIAERYMSNATLAAGMWTHVAGTTRTTPPERSMSTRRCRNVHRDAARFCRSRARHDRRAGGRLGAVRGRVDGRHLCPAHIRAGGRHVAAAARKQGRSVCPAAASPDLSPRLVADDFLPIRSWFIAGLGVLAAGDSCAASSALDRNVADRVKFHAIPVAMSVLYHGRTYDHTAYQSLARHFQTASLTAAELISWGVVAPAPPGDGTYYWAADDRGMADYVVGAFGLFGPHQSSLYYFYFLLLTISCALGLAGFWRHRVMTAVWLFALAGIYCCLAVIPLANLSDTFPEPPSLFEPRIFELLALVATLHIGLAGWLTTRYTPRTVAALIGQVLIFVFCYQTRSSVGWEAMFVVILSVAVIGRASGWHLQWWQWT